MLGSEPIRWHMVGRIQRNKARSIAGWAYAAHSVDSAKVIAALDRAAAEALAEGRRAEPLRVYIQLSLDGDEKRGGVDVGRPDRVDELCAAAEAAEGLEFVGLMAIPPLGSDPDDAFARLAGRTRAGTDAPTSSRLGLSAGMSSDLEMRGQTRFDVCACRYRAIGATTANVTMSSHSSHIFITDTTASGSPEGS